MTYERTIILLSGPIGSGKTTLAELVGRRYGACRISTSGILSESAGRLLNRGELLQVGLEERFQGGEWIVDAVMRSVLGQPQVEVIVVDAIRTVSQVRAVKNMGAGRWRILHVHLTADDGQLAQRYSDRASEADSGVGWAVARESLIEMAVVALESDADLTVSCPVGHELHQ